MRRVIWFFAVSILAAYSAFANQRLPLNSPAKKKVTEYGIQCTAVFAIFAELYEEKGDTENSSYYEGKFEAKYAEEEANFTSSGRDKNEFNKYVQKHVDGLAKIAPQLPKEILGLKERCDQMFP